MNTWNAWSISKVSTLPFVNSAQIRSSLPPVALSANSAGATSQASTLCWNFRFFTQSIEIQKVESDRTSNSLEFDFVVLTLRTAGVGCKSRWNQRSGSLNHCACRQSKYQRPGTLSQPLYRLLRLQAELPLTWRCSRSWSKKFTVISQIPIGEQMHENGHANSSRTASNDNPVIHLLSAILSKSPFPRDCQHLR